MTLNEVMQELEAYGNEQTKKTFMKHGAVEPFFGVKVGDMKKILKKTKKNHELSLALFDTGNGDAMYLAGLMADEKQINKEQLNNWVRNASWYMVSEYTVPWIASESPYGMELGLEWIESDEEKIASSGWSTLGSVASITPNEDIDLKVYEDLLDKVGNEIHDAPNRVRYVMNGFVIAVGSFIPELTEKAKEVAGKIGKVSVDMGGTACKVPLATDYIAKVEKMGRIGKKKKVARC